MTVTTCQLAPWGAPCGQDAAGLIRDGEGKTHPACRFHLYAADEFGWQPLTVSQLERSVLMPKIDHAAEARRSAAKALRHARDADRFARLSFLFAVIAAIPALAWIVVAALRIGGVL